MAFVVKNEFVSKDLENEIATAIKERRSVGQLLVEKKFVGTKESVEELTHILILYMGANMAIEFVFSVGLAEWQNYRKILVELWGKIADTENFTAKSKLNLGQQLYQNAQKDLGILFIKNAAATSSDVKTSIDIAQVINHETNDKTWAKETLIAAKEFAKTSDDYANIAKSLVKLANDEKEGKKTFKKAADSAKSFSEYCVVATAILKSLKKEREWAKSVFRAGLSQKDANSPLDTIAEEDYKEVLRKTRGKK